MSKKVLIITGAGGWLGYSLIKYLIEQIDNKYFYKIILCSQQNNGNKIIKYVNYLNCKKSISFEYCFGDLNQDCFYRKIKNLLINEDQLNIIHTAAVIHPISRSEFIKVNYFGLKKFVSYMNHYQINKFIYISSNSPFGFNKNCSKFDEKTNYAPLGFYGISKARAEKFLLKKFGKSTLKIIRAPWFHGINMPDRQKLFLKKAAFGKFPLINNGYNKRSIVNTLDLSIAAFNLIQRDSSHNIYFSTFYFFNIYSKLGFISFFSLFFKVKFNYILFSKMTITFRTLPSFIFLMF
mgnify:CR=1 FL=1